MIMRNPLNPLTHTAFGRRTAAACELIDYTTRRRTKPEFRLKTVETDAGPVPIREVSVLEETVLHLAAFRARRV